jgi:hypothetical protein
LLRIAMELLEGAATDRRAHRAWFLKKNPLRACHSALAHDGAAYACYVPASPVLELEHVPSLADIEARAGCILMKAKIVL